MSYLGTFSACFLALLAFKFVEPWLDVVRDKMMGWDHDQYPALARRPEPAGSRRRKGP